MKKLFKILLLMLVTAVVLTAAVACQKPESTLSVKEDAQPQLVHVQGEELDLSKGTLILKTGDNIEEIAMNAEGVSVSGYDNTKLGEQTVTITYGDASTTLKVSVVERMQIVDFATDYLVGDEFDRTKGRLRVTRNDGTTYTVILNNQDVVIEGFDSSAAGTGITVKAEYTSGQETYETSFKINVHNVDSVKLHAPNKKAYSSHEESIVLSGGYLTLIGNNGTLKKDIALTADGVTISGFDLGSVNAQTPSLNQTITVTYKNQHTESYEIKITYTSVSNFKDNVTSFASLDWSGTTLPTVSEELGDLALSLMDIYVDLAPADKMLISRDDLLSVARAAVLYGYNLWLEDLNEFEGAFSYEYDYYSYSYGLFMKCESYEAVESAVEKLKVADRPIYKVYEQLSNILAIESIADEVKVYVTTPIAGGSMFEAMIPVFETMLEFYDVYLPMIPADWQTNGVAAYSDEIETVYTYMANSGYMSSSNAWIFEQVAVWRSNNDDFKTFDALYRYYYEQQNAQAIAMLANTVLPTAFVELVDFIDVIFAQLEYIEYGYMYDTTEFFYNYYNLIDLAYGYANHSDEMIQFLYLYLPVNAVFNYGTESTVTFDSIVESIYLGGYVELCAALIEDQTFQSLMDKYMEVYGMSLDVENYLNSNEYGVAVEEMLRLFLGLTVPEQNLFLTTLMPYYSYGYYSFGEDEEVVDYVSKFNTLINEYYKSKLTTENAKEAYANLILAYEAYTLRLSLTTWYDDFETYMDSFESKYDLLDKNEQDAFDAYFGTINTACDVVLVKFADGGPKTDLGEWKAKFDELYSAVAAMNDATAIIEGHELDQQGYYFYNVFFCAYERTMSIVKDILENAPEAVKQAYYDELLYVIEYTMGSSSDIQRFEFTYDYVVTAYKANYMIYIYNVVGSLEIYEGMGFVEFFDLAYDLVLPYFNSVYYNMEELFVVDKADALNIMYAFSKMTPEAKLSQLLMEGGVYSSYYNAVDMFVSKNYSEKVIVTAFKLLDLEYAHIVYHYFEDDESLADIETVLDELEALYATLQGEDKTAFADFEELYTYYVELCEDLIAEAEEAPAN